MYIIPMCAIEMCVGNVVTISRLDDCAVKLIDFLVEKTFKNFDIAQFI